MDDKNSKGNLSPKERELFKRIYQDSSILGLQPDDILYLKDLLWGEIFDTPIDIVDDNEESNEYLPIPDQMTIGTIFREARFAQGLNQRDFAKILGVTQANISKIESGSNRKPTKRLLQAILPYTNYNPKDIFVLAGYKDESFNDIFQFRMNNKASAKRIILRILIEHLEEDDLADVIEYVMLALAEKNPYIDKN